MTSIMLALEHNITSTIIDSDKLAVEMSTRLISVLGLEDKIKIIHANGIDFNYAQFNTIYIAALAGLNSKIKNQIFKQIKKTAKKDIHLIARSSWRNRKLLYKPISPTIYKIFQPIIKVDPFNEIVNSVIILKNA
jgi:nicotianamine synthase